MRSTGLILLILLFAIAPAAAQDRRFTLDFAGGGTVPLAKAADVFASGLHLDFGTTVRIAEQAAIRVDYLYSAHGGSPDMPLIVPAGSTLALDVSHAVQYGSANLVLYPRMAGRLRPYGIAGAGFYRRSVELTAAGTGTVSLCHPNLYVCTSGLVPVADVLGSRSSSGAGFNMGGGVNFRANAGVQVFVEARWHYLASPRAQYLPMTVGVRF